MDPPEHQESQSEAALPLRGLSNSHSSAATLHKAGHPGAAPMNEETTLNTNPLSYYHDCVTADEYRAELEARNASSSTSPSLKRKSPAAGFLLPTNESVEHRDPLTVPLTEPRRCEYVIQLNEFCQKHALSTPIYEFNDQELPNEGIFLATLSLALPELLRGFIGTAIVENEPIVESYETIKLLEPECVLVVKHMASPGKKASKEGAAKQAFALLQRAIQLSRSRDVSTPTASRNLIALPVPENYIGILFEFAAATYSLPPSFFNFPIGNRFSCAVTVYFGATEDSRKDIFGPADCTFATKKAAKAYAAQEAVERLRAQGLLSGPDAPPLTAKKQRLLPPAEPDPSSTSLETPKTTYAHAAMLLTCRLGLTNCTYKLQPAPEGIAFWSGAAYFEVESEPLLQGPIGQVSGVFGKQNAKEQIARGVCAALQAFARAKGKGYVDPVG